MADRRTEDLANAVEGNRRMTVKVCGPEKEVTAALRSLNGVISAECIGNLDADSYSFVIESEGGLDIRKPLFSLLSKNNWPLIGAEAANVNLEDVFLALINNTATNETGKKKRISKKAKN